MAKAISGRKKEEQYELQEQIFNKGFSVVTCGECGDVLFHKASEVDLTCPHCGFEGEPCDFPDLYYSGWWK